MKKIFAVCFLIINFFSLYAQKMNDDDLKTVSDFIDCIKYKEMDKLITKISFPFRREYPIPEIKNKKEFLKRYTEVFDDSLTKIIINSKPSKDWAEMGWRGIMLLNGELWLDYDGRLIGINYHSKAERKKRDSLIKSERDNLYDSLKEFEEPVCILETAKYRIRIDDLGDGNYRYASWPLKNKMNEKPDIIIKKGEVIFEDSGGDHKYKFKNGDYIYECEIVVIGEANSPPAIFKIYKGPKEILHQNAISLKD